MAMSSYQYINRVILTPVVEQIHIQCEGCNVTPMAGVLFNFVRVFIRIIICILINNYALQLCANYE